MRELNRPQRKKLRPVVRWGLIWVAVLLLLLGVELMRHGRQHGTTSSGNHAGTAAVIAAWSAVAVTFSRRRCGCGSAGPAGNSGQKL